MSQSPVITNNMIPQLVMGKLLKGMYIKEGEKLEGTFRDKEDDPAIGIISDCRSNRRRIQLFFESGDGKGRISREIEIKAIQSNLGVNRGVNLYFICPISGKSCKILYFDPFKETFVHRGAYPQKIYYFSQIQTKDERIYSSEVKNFDKLVECFLRRKKTNYRGNPTFITKSINNHLQRRFVIERLFSDHQLGVVIKAKSKKNKIKCKM